MRHEVRTAAPLPDQAKIYGQYRCEGIRSMSQQGIVKFFNAERGYGFIKPDDGGRDIFVHITAVEQAGLNSLNEGQRVTFEIEADKKGKGPKAIDLHLI
jgi:CspA family cold shock protein